MITRWMNRVREGAARVAEWVRAHQGMIVKAAKTAATLIVVGGAMVALGKTIGAVAMGMRLLIGTFSLLATHPMVALVAGLTAVALALERVDRARYASIDSAWQALAEENQKRAADFAQVDRLKELAAKERLNAAEMKEARDLIGQLTSR